MRKVDIVLPEYISLPPAGRISLTLLDFVLPAIVAPAGEAGGLP